MPAKLAQPKPMKIGLKKLIDQFKALTNQDDSTAWDKARLAQEAADSYGQLKEFAKELGLSYSHVANIAHVARQFPNVTSGSNILTFKHYALVASNENRLLLLERAETQRWSTVTLAKNIPPDPNKKVVARKDNALAKEPELAIDIEAVRQEERDKLRLQHRRELNEANINARENVRKNEVDDIKKEAVEEFIDEIIDWFNALVEQDAQILGAAMEYGEKFKVAYPAIVGKHPEGLGFKALLDIVISSYGSLRVKPLGGYTRGEKWNPLTQYTTEPTMEMPVYHGSSE